MNLKNLAIGRGSEPIELHALGELWDLHNVLSFQGLALDGATRQAQMVWVGEPNVSLVDGTWQNNPQNYAGFILTFVDVINCQVAPGVQNAFGENDCLEVVSLDESGMRFEFRSGLSIVLSAREVEFRAQSSPAAS